MMIASLRATATQAFFMPILLASFTPQALSVDLARVLDERRDVDAIFSEDA
jgi:hypothetical protein